MPMPESTSEGSTGEYSLDEDDQLQSEDTLVDRGVADVLDEGYSPPERPRDSFGTTDYEQRQGESLDRRLAEEEPDLSDADEPASDLTDIDEVGDERAGRLIASDPGARTAFAAEDAGIDGAAASAEEAAVHVIHEE